MTSHVYIQTRDALSTCFQWVKRGMMYVFMRKGWVNCVRIGASDRTSWTLWAARDLQIGFGHVVVVNAVPVLYIVKKWLEEVLLEK
jgi:hypothetical protein